MQAVNLAQDEVVAIPVDRIKSGVVALATIAATNATAVFVLEVELFPGVFTAVGVFNAQTQVAADNITGPSKYAWADVPGAQSARIRRTDATGGNGSVGGSFALA